MSILSGFGFGSRGVLVCAGLVLGTGVGAEVAVPEVIKDVSGYVQLKQSDGGGTSSYNAALNWSDGAAPSGDKDYIVQGTRVLRIIADTAPFAGRSLTLDNGRIKMSANRATIDDLRIYGGRLEQSTVSSTKNIAGTIHVRGTAANPSRFSGSSGRTFQINSTLEGDETGVVKVMVTEEDGMTADFFNCWFNAENAATYKGCFRVEADTGRESYGYRVALYASKLANLGAGDPNGTSVITLKDRAAFYGSQGMAFNDPAYSIAVENAGTIGGRHTSGTAGIGVTFDGGVAIRGTAAGTPLYIRGNIGVVKLNDVTLENIGAMTVEAGTLLLGTDFENTAKAEVRVESGAALGGTTAAGGRVTLASGAQLAPGFGSKDDACIGQLGVASLTVEEGARLTYSVVSPDAVLSNDFIRVAGDLVNNSGEPIEIRFDRYPNHLPAGTRIPLLSAANLGAAVRPEGFRVSCVDEFLNRRIKGAFEVETIDGAPTLVFVQSSEPVVHLTGQDVSAGGGGQDSWASAGKWSDKLPPSAEKDYLVSGGALLRRSSDKNPDRFAGRSLAVTRDGDFAINGLTALVDDLQLFSGGILSTRNDGANNRLQGVATVYAAKGEPFNFEIEAGSPRTLNLEAKIQGAGDLRFRYYHTSYSKSGVTPPNTFYLVTGDNSAFTGGVELHQRAVCVDFKDEAAMGGPAPAFRADRLLFTSNATLRCSRSYVMSDPTRGITFGLGTIGGFEGGTIEVLEGQTLTVSNRIAGVADTTFRKFGPGTLALCCATNTFSGRILHWEGVIVVGAADAVARARFQSRSSALWRVDAPEGMTVASLDAVMAHDDSNDPNQTLWVRPRVFATQQTAGLIKANLVRFKGATAADAETALARVRLDDSDLGKNWMCEMGVEEVADGLLVTATARRRGMTLYIR